MNLGILMCLFSIELDTIMVYKGEENIHANQVILTYSFIWIQWKYAGLQVEKNGVYLCNRRINRNKTWGVNTLGMCLWK